MFDVFSNEEFVTDLAKGNKSLLEKIKDFLNEFISELRNMIKHFTDSPELTALREQKKVLEDINKSFISALETATQEMQKNLQNTKKNTAYRTDVTEKAENGAQKARYSFKYDSKGKKYWHIDTQKDIFKGLNSIKEYENAAFNYILGLRDKKVIFDALDGKKIQFIRISAEEFTNSQESKGYKKNASVIFAQKMRLIPSLEDLAKNANVNWQSPDEKNHKLFKDRGFENFRGRVGIDNVIFNYVVRSGKTSFGDVFYDINLEVDQILPHTKSASGIKGSTSNTNISQEGNGVNSNSTKSTVENSLSEHKKAQLDIINKFNPAPNTYNAWIRTVEDIKTFEDALNDDEYADYDEFNPDYDRAAAENALKTGEITVYSSYPIEQGVFVTPSYMEAESYSGNGVVYSKTVSLDSVAWLDVTQGQYAEVEKENRKSIKLSSSAEKLLKSSPELQMVIKDLQQQTKLSHGYIPEAKRIHSYAYELKKTC